ITSGAPAEYGRFSGGLLSAVTRAGGNRFSGSYRANLADQGWTSPTPFEACDPAVTAAGCLKAAARTGALNVLHEASLGGFALKDNLWFFSAGALADTTESTALPVSGTANTESISNRRGSLKITAAASNQTITFDAATNLVTNDGHPAFAYTVDAAAIGK